MITTHHKLMIGICTEYKDYREIDDRKGAVLSGNQTRNLMLHFWRRATLLICFSGISSLKSFEPATLVSTSESSTTWATTPSY